MKGRIANVIMTFMTCVVVLCACSSPRESLGNGLYCYKDKSTSLLGVKNQSGDIIIPAYAKNIEAYEDVIVCYSPEDRGMVYKTDGAPLFYEEFDYIIDNHKILRCYQPHRMYLYVYNTNKPLGPVEKCVATYMNNTVILSNKFSVDVYNLSSEETREILYNTPVGEKKSVSWLEDNHRVYTGMMYGENIYAVREATGEDIKTDEIYIECQTADKQAVFGEDSGECWTFLLLSNKKHSAKLYEAPKDSWIVYDKSRNCDYLIIPQGWHKKICNFDGTEIKKLSLLEWLKLRRQSQKIGKLGKLKVVCIKHLSTD